VQVDGTVRVGARDRSLGSRTRETRFGASWSPADGLKSPWAGKGCRWRGCHDPKSRPPERGPWSAPDSSSGIA